MIWTALLIACSGAAENDTSVAAPETVTLTTRDGVDLVADVYPASGQDRPGIVLLHMTPAGPWKRQDWPISFIDTLRAHDWSVVAIDRRGAGESGGEGSDAYTGEKGRYDVEAAVKALQEHGLGQLGIIGASNGTTSMIDYAAWASGEGLPEVTAMGFMTGGSYTENQTTLASVAQAPSIFTFSTEERAWSVAQESLDPGSWSFKEYSTGAHGTRMFDAAPEVAADLDAFLDGVLD